MICWTGPMPKELARTVLALYLLTSPVLAGDWPAYRHDARRSNVCAEELRFPLQFVWSYTCAQPPAPAWPEQLDIINRVDFDYAPQPVIAGGILCFGSSADDTVRALDAVTGKEVWHFTTGGPVRIAPQIVGSNVYFGSDDGKAYCLNVANGKPVWTFQAAPRNEQLLGNHRMISRWPLRSGVLVVGGVAYCVAGLWSTEGVFIYALHADTGKVLWCNDTSGYGDMQFNDFIGMGINGHHQGEFGSGGSNPQGPLVADGATLVVPNGFSGPSYYDRQTGKPLLREPGGAAGSGGTWLTIDRGHLYCFAKHGQGGNVLMIQGNDLVSGKAGKPLRHLPQLSIGPQVKPTELHEKGKVCALIHEGKWHVRKALGLVLADSSLLVGQDGVVTAEKIDVQPQVELWRAEVDGEAREIAVANGRLYVATRRGVIYCFASATKQHESAKVPRPRNAMPVRLDTEIISKVRRTGMDRGCALVLGDTEGRVSMALAAETRLHIVNLLTKEEAAATLREKLLAETAWYGSRIQVQSVPRLDRLPFAQFFANVVIVSGPCEGLLSAGKELYRVLRPCGGTLLCPGLNTAEAETLIKYSGAPSEELRRTDDELQLVRGKLPGALDWDSPRSMTGDQRVKWPLRPLWFGGPSTLQTRNFRQGADGPVMANGRYFIKGEDSLTAVDAYNGEVLWSRPIPKQWSDIREVDGVLYPVSEAKKYSKLEHARQIYVNDNSVFLVLGPAYVRSQGELMIQLDARTGQQQKVFGAFIPPTAVSLEQPQTWPVELDPMHSGTVTLESADRGLVVTLTTKDPRVTSLDAWDLCFDFRPPEVRYALYEHGAIHIQLRADRAAAVPWLETSSMRTADGLQMTCLLPWAELEKLAGVRPSSFAFAATLNSHDGGRDEPIVRRHLFGDWAADLINNGWASVTLREAAQADVLAKTPAIVAGTIADAKGQYGVARDGRSLDEAIAGAPRIHPLTGDPEPKVYRPSRLCGASYFSDCIMTGRSGIYDFDDDSGLRFVGGVKTGCTSPQVVSQGLILFSDETGHCSCNYPMRTNMAMAPADRRLNEDWALFHDRDADTQVRQAAINFGAPGDRRDEDGMLWLGYPRPPADKGLGYSFAAGKQHAITANGVWMRFTSSAIQVPLEVQSLGGPEAYQFEENAATFWKWMTVWSANRHQKNFGPHRINTDRVKIIGTDRPWIYGSFFRGIHRATMKLNLVPPVASLACEQPPMLDGDASDAVWAGDPQILLPFTKTKVRVRHDRDHVYLAARREAVIDRRGKSAPWFKSTEGEDAPIWSDDALEVFLTDAEKTHVLHLGISASGARYDALASAAETEDKAFDGNWRSAVRADDRELSFELAIPRMMLAQAGIKGSLAINVQINQKDVSGEALEYPGYAGRNYDPKETSGEALCNLGMHGRARCEHFAPLGLDHPAAFGPRAFTVRLHFAELDEVQPGQRVFDVKLQGQTVLKDFDVVREAGDVYTAVSKEFRHVQAGDALSVEFSTSSATLAPNAVPILNAIELYDEAWRRE